jgi:hypothetical protein
MKRGKKETTIIYNGCNTMEHQSTLINLLITWTTLTLAFGGFTGDVCYAFC